MAIRYDLLWLILIAFALAYATNIIVHNTINYEVISDTERYVKGIQDGTINRLGVQLLSPLIGNGTEDFRMKTNFLIFLSIGWLVYSSTKNWAITLLSLLGFSVSLIVYFSLLAQGIAIIMGLWLWTKIDPFEKNHAVRNHAIYILAGSFMFLTHQYGGLLCLLIYIVRLVKPNKEEATLGAVMAFIAAGALMFTCFFQATERVTFFFYPILPMSMGALDMVYWLGLFTVILWMLIKCEDSAAELAMGGFIFFGTIANYIFVSQVALDFWRVLIFFELIALIRIGKSQVKSDLIKWGPLFLILLFIERLMVGLLV